MYKLGADIILEESGHWFHELGNEFFTSASGEALEEEVQGFCAEASIEFEKKLRILFQDYWINGRLKNYD